MTTATLHDVLSVDLHFHPGACSVRLSGELDRLSCPQLAAGVDRALSACGVVVLVVVDLHHVSFCDLDGLRALEAARTRAERQGVRVRCEGSSPLLRRVASLLGFEELLTSSP